MFTFLVEGVLMFIVGCLGLGGNLFSLTLLLKRKAQKTFHNLLLLHCSFDMVGGNVNLLSIGCCVLNKVGLRRKPKNHKTQSQYNMTKLSLLPTSAFPLNNKWYRPCHNCDFDWFFLSYCSVNTSDICKHFSILHIKFQFSYLWNTLKLNIITITFYIHYSVHFSGLSCLCNHHFLASQTWRYLCWDISGGEFSYHVSTGTYWHGESQYSSQTPPATSLPSSGWLYLHSSGIDPGEISGCCPPIF